MQFLPNERKKCDRRFLFSSRYGIRYKKWRKTENVPSFTAILRSLRSVQSGVISDVVNVS